MHIVSRLLEAAIALVFVFGLLGYVLTGSRASSRPLARRASADNREVAWVTGFGGTLGWDGSDSAAPSHRPATQPGK